MGKRVDCSIGYRAGNVGLCASSLSRNFPRPTNLAATRELTTAGGPEPIAFHDSSLSRSTLLR